VHLSQALIHERPRETVRKGLGGVCNVASRGAETVLLGPFLLFHSGQMRGRSVARTLFERSQKRRSRKLRYPV
jgi:hypothetical protein